MGGSLENRIDACFDFSFFSLVSPSMYLSEDRVGFDAYSSLPAP